MKSGQVKSEKVKSEMVRSSQHMSSWDRSNQDRTINPISQGVSISSHARGRYLIPPLGNQGRRCFKPHVALHKLKICRNVVLARIVKLFCNSCHNLQYEHLGLHDYEGQQKVILFNSGKISISG